MSRLWRLLLSNSIRPTENEPTARNEEAAEHQQAKRTYAEVQNYIQEGIHRPVDGMSKAACESRPDGRIFRSGTSPERFPLAFAPLYVDTPGFAVVSKRSKECFHDDVLAAVVHFHALEERLPVTEDPRIRHPAKIDAVSEYGLSDPVVIRVGKLRRFEARSYKTDFLLALGIEELKSAADCRTGEIDFIVEPGYPELL